MHYSTKLCIHQVFEHYAASRPEAIALVCGDRTMTYAELNTRANRVAWHLSDAGVGPNVRVGISIGRTFERIIGVLGILKAGGAYLSLERTDPPDRLAFVTQDAGVTIVLVNGPSPHGASFGDATTIDVSMVSSSAAPSTVNPAVSMSSEDLAYVTYTSGSTGTPKGVEIPHRGVLRLVLDVSYVTLNADQTLLHLASLSFDASTFELWAALLHGARCVLYHPDFPILSELETIITGNRVTTMVLTTPLFNAMIDEIPQALAGVSQLLVGGEALSVKHVRKAIAVLPRTQIINGYGPTENTTFTCCYRVPRTLAASLRSIPIGVPVERTWVYVLDEHLHPVTNGGSGELWTGGDGLARGYLNRPELTEERFIRNPFDPDVAPRIYRTGDLVRILDDGTLDFLGRVDDQIKIRGFRIELGEIEARIRSHASIRDAAVIVQENDLGEKAIVAYVQPSQPSTFVLDELQAFLRAHLSPYMLPSFFLVLPSLPLTSGNKIDRHALANPWQARHHDVPANGLPMTDIEQIVHAAWCEVLHTDRFGLDDNFFEVGGQSIAAVRVHMHLQSTLKREIPITMLFQHATIRSLATQLAGTESHDALSAAQERARRQALAMRQRRLSGTPRSPR